MGVWNGMGKEKNSSYRIVVEIHRSVRGKGPFVNQYRATHRFCQRRSFVDMMMTDEGPNVVVMHHHSIAVLVALLLSFASQVAASGRDCRTAQTAAVPSNYVLNATAWEPCVPKFTTAPRDVPYQCRRVSVPALYCPDSSDDEWITVLERRMVRGTPKRAVFLLSGGPGGSSALVAWAVGSQAAAALGTDFALHIPALRGTYNTTAITRPWKDVPNATLWQYLNDTTLPPYRAFTFTNAARDVIFMIRDARAAYQNGTAAFAMQAAGFSYGTVMLQRIASLDPTLIRDYLLDGTVPQQFWHQPFIFQSENLPSVIAQIANNCAKDAFCAATSLSYNSIVAFVDSMAAGATPKTTMCTDFFVDSAAKGEPAADVFFSVAKAIALVSNIAANASLLKADTKDPAVQQQFIDAALQSMSNQPSGVYLDFRVLLWSFINQLAQCASGNIGRIPSFAKGMKPIGTILGALGPVGAALLNYTAPTGNEMVTQLLMLLGENAMDCSNATFDRIRAAMKSSAVRNAKWMYESEESFCNATADISKSWQRDPWARSAVPTLSANVLFLNGLLDPNAAFAMFQAAFNQIQVAPGFSKTYYTHNNAGHTVISLGWSPCVGNLMLGFFTKDSVALAKYDACRLAENNRTLDWEATALRDAFDGISIWEGLPETIWQSALIYTAIVVVVLLAAVGLFFCVRRCCCRQAQTQDASATYDISPAKQPGGQQ